MCLLQTEEMRRLICLRIVCFCSWYSRIDSMSPFKAIIKGSISGMYILGVIANE